MGLHALLGAANIEASTMTIRPADQSVIREAAEIIRRGGVGAFPTETVYGLGADVFNADAVARIFDIKGRPHFDPLIVHVSDFQFVDKLCGTIPVLAEKLMRKFWPGALTLVLSKKDIVPDIVTAGLPTVAIRMPNHPVAIELIRCSGTAIAAPSANPFEYLSPTTALHVQDQLGDRVDFILDAGACSIGIESTILDLSGDIPTLLRPGGITLEEMDEIIGPIALHRGDGMEKPKSPGLLSQHYSPRTPIRMLGSLPLNSHEKKGLLAFKSVPMPGLFEMTEVLSLTGDLREAAINLFSCLHRLDHAGLDRIYVEPVPEIGLGQAIMDRLRRACSAKTEIH